MIANRILLATLGIMVCSFFPRGAQQSDEPLPLLPSPQNLGTAPVTEPAPLQISPTPTVFPPAKVGGGVTQNKSPLTFSSELGSQWDRCYQELQAQDEEIKRAEEHLVQLRNQRRIRAEKLAEIAKQLAPLVSKAQEELNAASASATKPKVHDAGRNVLPSALNLRGASGKPAEPSKDSNGPNEQLQQKLESIEQRIKSLEKKPASPKPVRPLTTEGRYISAIFFD